MSASDPKKAKKSGENGFSQSIVETITCPITAALPVVPVLAKDGRIYEKAAIKRWFRQGKSLCPIKARSPITNKEICTDLMDASATTRPMVLSAIEHGIIDDESAAAWHLESAHAKINQDLPGGLSSAKADFDRAAALSSAPAPQCLAWLDCKRAYFGTELYFCSGVVFTKKAICVERSGRSYCRLMVIMAREIESIVYKTQDDADAGPIDLCGDDEPADLSDGGPVVKFLALTLDESARVQRCEPSRDHFDPSQNPGPRCHVVLDLAGSAARVFTDDVLEFLFDNYSHATINPISGADAAAPYLLGVTDADAVEKRRRAMQNEAEPAAAAPRGGVRIARDAGGVRIPR